MINIVDVDIELVVKSMSQEKTRSAYDHGATYLDIATQWFKYMPLKSLDKRRYANKQLGHQISLMDTRESFFFRYKNKDTGKMMYWFDWFTKNYPLWHEITKGDKLRGVVTEMMFNFNIQHAIHNLTSKEIYTAWEAECEKTKLKRDNAHKNYKMDEIPIDLDNLGRYIRVTEHDIKDAFGKKKETMQMNLVEAQVIQAMTIAHNKPIECDMSGRSVWLLPQLYYDVDLFERRYYVTSVALQGMHSTLRKVCLGKGYGIDLNTSVYAFYKIIASGNNIDSNIITEMMENKNAFREDVASVLLNTFENSRVKKVKRAITAMGFGAKCEDFGAVDEILKDKEDLKAFNTHPRIVRLKKFQKEILAWVKEEYIDDIKPLGVDFRVGKNYNFKKYLAMMYQQYETDMMKKIMDHVESTDTAALMLWVHDGIYIKGKVNPKDIQYIITQFNPFASAEFEKVEYWSDRKLDAEGEIEAEDRMMGRTKPMGSNTRYTKTQKPTAGHFTGEGYDGIYNETQEDHDPILAELLGGM